MFRSNRLNNRWKAGAISQKIMATVGDSGAERPCLKGDIPPVILRMCVCYFIRIKRRSPSTEQAYFDWIKRFIHFHSKRHQPEVEAHLWNVGRMVDCSLVVDKHQPMSAMARKAQWPQVAGRSPTRRRRSRPSYACTGMLCGKWKTSLDSNVGSDLSASGAKLSAGGRLPFQS